MTGQPRGPEWYGLVVRAVAWMRVRCLTAQASEKRATFEGVGYDSTKCASDDQCEYAVDHADD